MADTFFDGVLGLADWLSSKDKGYPMINKMHVAIDPKNRSQGSYKNGVLNARGRNYDSAGEMLLKTLYEYSQRAGRTNPLWTPSGYEWMDYPGGPELDWRQMLSFSDNPKRYMNNRLPRKLTPVEPYNSAELRPNPVDVIEHFRAKGVPQGILDKFANNYFPYIRGERGVKGDNNGSK